MSGAPNCAHINWRYVQDGQYIIAYCSDCNSELFRTKVGA